MKLAFQILLLFISTTCLSQNNLDFPIKIKNTRFDWSSTQFQKDTLIFKDFISNHKPEFEYYLLKDEYTPTINDLYQDLYLIDINGDKQLDIVFDGESGGEPYSIKIFIRNNKTYKKALDVQQSIKKMEFNGLVLSKLFITDWGCCAEIIEHNYTYKVNFSKTSEQFELIYTSQSYENLKWPTYYLDSKIKFKTLNNNYNFRFEPVIDDTTKYEIEPGLFFGNSIGRIPKNSIGYALSEKKDKTGRIWWFVAIESSVELKNALYYTEKSKKDSYYLGWISSRFIEKL